MAQLAQVAANPDNAAAAKIPGANRALVIMGVTFVNGTGLPVTRTCGRSGDSREGIAGAEG
jgi:hypothetical protein